HHGAVGLRDDGGAVRGQRSVTASGDGGQAGRPGRVGHIPQRRRRVVAGEERVPVRGEQTLTAGGERAQAGGAGTVDDVPQRRRLGGAVGGQHRPVGGERDRLAAAVPRG